MVLSVSKSWFTGLWMASGIRPLMIWDTTMSGASITSCGNMRCAAPNTVSIKLWWEMVTSLSLLNTGTTQSSLKWAISTGLVLASIKWRLCRTPKGTTTPVVAGWAGCSSTVVATSVAGLSRKGLSEFRPTANSALG